MRTIGALVAFLRTCLPAVERAIRGPFGRPSAAVAALPALACALLVASVAPAQTPPRIPGLPGFGKPAIAEEPPTFGDSRDRVEVKVAVAATEVAPGGDIPVAITFTLSPHWHIWPKPGAIPADLADFESSIRTTIDVNPGADGKIVAMPGIAFHDGFAQWPAPIGVEFDIGEGPKKYAVHEGVFTVYLPMSVAADAKPGAVEIPIRVGFQACDENGCLAPSGYDLVARFTIAAAPAAAPANEAFGAFDPSVYARIRSGEKPSELLEFNLFSWKFSIDPRGTGLLVLLLIAAAGGFILNFTPCVLPVIPLKIMGLAQAAQGSRAKCFALGFTMSLGVVAFWMLLGTLMATVQGFTSANQLFQMPWFTILVGVVISAMAIGMAGFFSVKLPDWVYMVEAKHDSYGGSFLFGIMTAVLSTPCTAPLMGTAVAWSTTQGVATILAVFAAVGVGMALPYLVLSAYPNLVDRMPRSGPSSDLIKQVMGLLLLAAGAYFAGAGISGLLVTPPEPPGKAYWWAVTVLGTAAGAWLLWRGFRIAAARWPLAVALIIVGWAFLAGASLFLTALLGAMELILNRLSADEASVERIGELAGRFIGGAACMAATLLAMRWLCRRSRVHGGACFSTLFGLLILGPSVLIGLSQTAKGPVDWTYYTPERLEEARADGKVVVVDFTAEWCANCKTLEALVLNLPGVSKELNAEDVAAIKVDLTGNNEAGNALLKASNRVTIPLLLVYGRDGSLVMNASDYTPQQVLDAITAARATGAARGQ